MQCLCLCGWERVHLLIILHSRSRTYYPTYWLVIKHRVWCLFCFEQGSISKDPGLSLHAAVFLTEQRNLVIVNLSILSFSAVRQDKHQVFITNQESCKWRSSESQRGECSLQLQKDSIFSYILNELIQKWHLNYLNMMNRMFGVCCHF